ncbi:ARM repeat-containing protein [Lichtheimia hyalospora FSU 10163]|nr:ARM repeat-containing protein [Lichtheimia hyalospora FSU 10163]
MSNSLSFLRGAHTKTTTTSSSAYHDIPTTSSMDTSRPSLPMRRARAGTMPSMVHLPEERAHRSPLLRPSAAAAVAAADTRHRSGSLNLPVPPPLTIFGSSWSSGIDGNQQQQQQQNQQVRSSLPSPATEQLLRGDRDFSIARTLRSLGLEDESNVPTAGASSTAATNNGLYHHHHHHHTPYSQHHRQEQPTAPATEILVPGSQGRSLLSGNRSRSYSVNAASRYQDRTIPAHIAPPLAPQAATQPPTTTPAPPTTSPPMRTTRARASTFANPLDSLTVQRNRPRASSMGRMDYDRGMNPPSSLWQMQLPTLDSVTDDESSYVDREFATKQPESSLSLGDSELLANMLHTQQVYNDTIPSEQHQDTVYMNGNGVPEPYLHYSQSTPTFRNHQAQMMPSTSSPTQTATRSLWIGNIDSTVTIENLTQLFSSFGPIESVRLLLEKECAFVNFFHVEDAIRAKEEVLGRLGGRVGNCIVRIGYGRADAAIPDTTALQPTRALWLGNIPSGMAPSTLQHIFSSFGAIESVRVLSHKNCGFVNFEQVDSASKAREALLQNEIGVQGFAGVRVGFAKVPPAKTGTANDGITPTTSGIANANNSNGVTKLHGDNDRATMEDGNSWLTDLWSIMKEYDAEDKALNLVKALETSSGYFESIPPVPEFGATRKFDAARLREIRKKLDNAGHGTKEVETIAYDCMDEIAELSSDYIGNTVVQRLFEKCTEDTKAAMLKRIGPHMAAISVHKNGTWAAQKIIDTIKTPEQIHLVCTHLRPYVPPLLLDQFGNYAVQCCLRLGDGNNQFIFDAMVEKLLNVAQGRFGARAMRGTLDNQHVTLNQKIFVASALTQNALSLSTNPNGALLLSWLMESSNLEKRYSLLAKRLMPHLVQVATHKLGSQTLLKLVNQDHEEEARRVVLEAITEENALQEIISDSVRGSPLIQKIISSTYISEDQHEQLVDQVCPLLNKLQGPAHKKLLDELENNNNNNDHHSQ